MLGGTCLLPRTGPGVSSPNLRAGGCRRHGDLGLPGIAQAPRGVVEMSHLRPPLRPSEALLFGPFFLEDD